MNLPNAQPPYYFRRVWNPSYDQAVLAEHLPDGIFDSVIALHAEPLTIFGRKIVSPYAADTAHIREAERRGQIYTESFSVACVDGEVGSQPARECSEISEQEFEAARARGWRDA